VISRLSYETTIRGVVAWKAGAYQTCCNFSFFFLLLGNIWHAMWIRNAFVWGRGGHLRKFYGYRDDSFCHISARTIVHSISFFFPYYFREQIVRCSFFFFCYTKQMNPAGLLDTQLPIVPLCKNAFLIDADDARMTNIL
jgi:hypothetical protein